jgi:5-methyltetrahydropteroyltriglutamate--homocysteine methyltransferase
MIDYFIRPMSGIRSQVTRCEIDEFSRQEGMSFRVAPAGVVVSPIDEGQLNIPHDFLRAKACTQHPMKFTVTGPHMLCKTLIDHHYPNRHELALALARAIAKQVAEIDCEVFQVDEANITGHPQEIAWAADAINLVLDAATCSKHKGVHLCFGNYGGQSIQVGTWKPLMKLINSLHCDHVLLEFAFHGYDDLAFFRDGVDPQVGLGIGVIDVKSNIVETPEVVAARIESAVQNLGVNRIKWVHPDCGFWMNKRSIADRKMANLVRGRDMFLGIRS